MKNKRNRSKQRRFGTANVQIFLGLYFTLYRAQGADLMTNSAYYSCPTRRDPDHKPTRFKTHFISKSLTLKRLQTRPELFLSFTDSDTYQNMCLQRTENSLRAPHRFGPPSAGAAQGGTCCSIVPPAPARTTT